MGKPDADIRSGPLRCSHFAVLASFRLSLSGLVYDLQRVAICSSPEPMATPEANMLFKTALTLLVAWLIGVLAVHSAGDLVHVLLLAGLALLLLAFLRAREAAIRRDFGALYQLRSDFLCLIRPDGHVGLVQALFDEAHLIDYLALISAPSEVRRCFV